jgi:hypothetical protein
MKTARRAVIKSGPDFFKKEKDTETEMEGWGNR